MAQKGQTRERIRIQVSQTWTRIEEEEAKREAQAKEEWYSLQIIELLKEESSITNEYRVLKEIINRIKMQSMVLLLVKT